MQEILLKILGFSVAGIISGVLLVAIFNRIPPSWLTEYGQTPSEEVRSRERLKWIPYAPVLAIGFGLVYAKLAYFDIYYALPAMITIWTARRHSEHILRCADRRRLFAFNIRNR